MSEILAIGDEGSKVYAMTQLLVDVGLLETAQREFDVEVEMALKAWQHHGIGPGGRALKVDGVFGPNTEASLISDHLDLDLDNLPVKLEDAPTPTNPLAQLVIEYAVRELRAGAREIGGNNQGEFVDKYHRTTRASEQQWAWCAAFTSWCYQQAANELDIEMPFKYTGGAQNIFKQFKEKGWDYDPTTTTPMSGDVIVWWRGQTKTWKGHVGIVWGTINDVIYVIEGNVGRFPAHVRVFSYELKDMTKLIGFGRTPQDMGW